VETLSAFVNMRRLARKIHGGLADVDQAFEIACDLVAKADQ
jgi:hypothetical protein